MLCGGVALGRGVSYVLTTDPAAGSTQSVAARVRAVPLLRRDRLLFIGYASLYLAVGAWLVLVRHLIVGDAAARVGQAWYVIASRDPHLAAVGFVWNPLPSILEIPLVALRGLWPALTQEMFAA